MTIYFFYCGEKKINYEAVKFYQPFSGLKEDFRVFFLSLFIYFERDRHSASGKGVGGEGQRESQAGSTLSAQSPLRGSNP